MFFNRLSVIYTGTFFLLFAASTFAGAGLIWPTPNPAFQEGKSLDAFIQPTVSGETESGLFGCVRNNGSRFHEALDLFPVQRNRKGEPMDAVFSVLPGRVVHVNATAGYSSYGRYVVVLHDGEAPAYHTLYAHLASVAEDIKPGARVAAGTPLGVMGRSAAGYVIPTQRAHLHFEIGFKLTDDFQAWYDRQKYGSKNRHGLWNGMNLVSIDPLGFYQAMRAGQVKNLYEYLKILPAVARIRIFTTQIPDFVENYAALVTRPYVGQQVIAWDIAFSQYGLPKEWTPRFADEDLAGEAGNVSVLAYSPDLLSAQTCRQVLNIRSSGPTVSAGTLDTLKKLFGFK
ncbi:MAG: murein DD-endopeptidase MepM/ murein hydrolase activator NlpD [Lentimonas sp.]|jgi:murein DD-endopeptidase MepM/ murein hydrolase activator NlpD